MIENGGFSYKPILDDEDKPRVFPLCVDNFFDEPDTIREWANTLPKERSVDGSWPGYRTSPLHEIDYEFHVTLFLKVLSAYYDLKYANASWSSCRAHFQVIPKYSEENHSQNNVGWIHQDDGDELAGLIYLTPNADINSGTSLFGLKKEHENTYLKYANNPHKHAMYNGMRIEEEEYKKALHHHNDKFVETVRFGNVYNRLVMYGSQEYHRANSFVTNSEDRMTLVFFMNGIKSGTDERTSRYPLSRVKDTDNFDYNLKARIKYLNSKII